jgi:ABC-type oligopeptide transport system substrate-binding subunit
MILKPNPNYWKTDAQGHRLPYWDSIRLDIRANHDIEMLRFKRGELDTINSLDSAAWSPGFHLTQSRA